MSCEGGAIDFLEWFYTQDWVLFAMTTVGWILLALFVVGLSMSWSSLRGAPWVPTPMRSVRRILEIAEVTPHDTIYDLGCGDGRLLIATARRHGARAVGVEIDPLRYLWCQVRITLLGLRGRVKVRFGNLFKLDLSEATVVVAYLLPDTNRRLQHKLAQELAPGARIVAHSFTFPALEQTGRDEDFDLYLYRPQMTVPPADSTA